MSKIKLSLLVAAFLAFQLDAAFAMGNGHGNGQQNRGNSGNSGQSSGNGGGGSVVGAVGSVVQQVANALTALERRTIASFFQTNQSSLPPGLARRQSLPPGLQRQLERNGTLPPGLTRNRLPPALQSQLPGRENMEILVLGRDIILVAAATSLIVDILFDVF